MSCRRCGCPRDAHEHYRAGSDCGTCGRGACPFYRRTRTKIIFAKIIFWRLA